MYYRIEPTFHILQRVKLVIYPSKEVLVRLRTKLNAFTYKGAFSMLDSQSNKWINGSI